REVASHVQDGRAAGAQKGVLHLPDDRVEAVRDHGERDGVERAHGRIAWSSADASGAWPRPWLARTRPGERCLWTSVVRSGQVVGPGPRSCPKRPTARSGSRILLWATCAARPFAAGGGDRPRSSRADTAGGWPRLTGRAPPPRAASSPRRPRARRPRTAAPSRRRSP